MKKGFTLVEIMVVVVIIAILVGLAIPNLLTARLVANEHSAISNLQTVSVAAQTYWSVQNILPITFNDLYTASYIDRSWIITTPPIKNGYEFYIRSGSATDFFVYATPHALNRTGRRSFCAGSDGVVMQNPLGVAPNSQAECTDWEQL